ncbi:MAG: hypothetical protein KDA17_07795 [Candidatus Saccharibacteria bacterium]|nr:hypothetical protein [Candidatus Saccharibacteria bacterium]
MPKISNILSWMTAQPDWLTELVYANQRRKYGWSDRDAWNGGDYILEVTSGLLHHIHHKERSFDNEYFSAFVNKSGYLNLEDVADGIDLYLDAHNVKLVDYIDAEDGKDVIRRLYMGNNNEADKKLLRAAVNKYEKEIKRRQDAARKSMKFVYDKIQNLWD